MLRRASLLTNPSVTTFLLLCGTACGGRSDISGEGNISGGGAGGRGGAQASGGASGSSTGGVVPSGGNGSGSGGVGVGGSTGGALLGGAAGVGASAGRGGSSGGWGGAGGSSTGGEGIGGSVIPFSCPLGSWDENYPSGMQNCLPWTSCSPGYAIVVVGTATEDRQCEPCEDGTFTASANERACEPWTECEFWEVLGKAGTPSRNVGCALPKEFVPIPTFFGGLPFMTGPRLAATEDGLYVTGRHNSTFVGKYSFDGTSRSTYHAPEEPSQPNSILAVGTKVLVAGSELGVPTSVSQQAFLAEFNTVPSRLSKQNLGLSDSAIRDAILASDGTDFYLAGAYYPPSCAGSCGAGDQGYLFLAKFDEDLNLLEERMDIPLPSADVPTLHGLEVAEDGTLVVLGGGTYAETRFSIEVSGDGTSHSLLGPTDLGCTNCAGLSTGPGGLLTMVGNRVDPSGNHLAGQAIRVRSADGTWSEVGVVPDSGDDVYEDLVATSTGIYLVGQDTLAGDAVFVHLDPYGMLLFRSVLGSVASTERATSVVEASSGKIYAAGVSERELNGRSVFVVPWPQ